MTRRRSRASGFTILEIIVTMLLFGIIMVGAYELLVEVLKADARVKQYVAKGRVGESILTLMRRDLQGLVFEGFGPYVFLSENEGGLEEGAEDGLHFLTTAPVPAPVDYEYWEEDVAAVGVASVGYTLRQSQNNDHGFTLFRRVRWQLDDEENRFDGDSYFPVYDLVKALELTYLDRDWDEDGAGDEDWKDEWKSEERYPEEEDEEFEPEDDEPRSDDDSELDEEEDLIVPRAVRITLWIYLADEDGLKEDASGDPVVERYSTIVPILSSEAAKLPIDDEEL